MTAIDPLLQADEPDILNHVDTDQKLVALTFDDGPDAPTLELMRLIEAEGGRATFFVVGKTIRDNPDILRMTARAGHEIGNHSFTHSSLPELGPEAMRKEILETQELIAELTGRKPVLFRAPYLNYNAALHAVLQDAHLRAVNADRHTRDWDVATTVEEIIERATAELAPGNIILMHSWPGNTLAAMPEILRILRENGYRMVTVSELLRQSR